MTTNKPHRRKLPNVPGTEDEGDEEAIFKELLSMRARIDELKTIRAEQEAEIVDLTEQLEMANAGELSSNPPSARLTRLIRTRCY